MPSSRCEKGTISRLRNARFSSRNAHAAGRQLWVAVGRRCLAAATHLACVALSHVGKKGQVVGTHEHLKEARAGCCQLLNVIPAGRHVVSCRQAASSVSAPSEDRGPSDNVEAELPTLAAQSCAGWQCSLQRLHRQDVSKALCTFSHCKQEHAGVNTSSTAVVSPAQHSMGSR